MEVFEAEVAQGPGEAAWPCVLLVEDDPHLQQILTRLLRLSGYRVAAARGGEEAWPVLQSGGVDLVVTDLCLPGMSGLDLVARARSEGMRWPVIVMAGALPGDETDLESRLQVGLMLEKPFPILRLQRAVAELLSARSPERAGPAGCH